MWNTRKEWTPESLKIDTPFQQAGKLWGDVLGASRREVRAWRGVAGVAVGVAVGCAGALVSVATDVRTYPFIVEVAETGQVRSVGVLPQPASRAPESVRLVVLRDWIERTRSISKDPVVFSRNWEKVWAYSTPQAQEALKRYVDGTQLRERAGVVVSSTSREVVAIDIQQILPVVGSESTYQIRWTETTTDYQANSVKSIQGWTAVVYLVHRPAKQTAPIPENPLGLFIDDFTWRQDQ
jgi:type IV secretion system protein VirB5